MEKFEVFFQFNRQGCHFGWIKEGMYYYQSIGQESVDITHFKKGKNYKWLVIKKTNWMADWVLWKPKQQKNWKISPSFQTKSPNNS